MKALTGDFADHWRNYQEQIIVVGAFRRALAYLGNLQGRDNRGEYWWFVFRCLTNISTQVFD